MVVGDFPELLAQEEVGLAVQRRELAQEVVLDVGADGVGRREEAQVEGNAAADEIRLRPVGRGPAGMEQGRLAEREGLEENLRRAPPEEGTPLAEDVPLHEPDVGAAEDQQDIAPLLPRPVQLLLQDRWKLGTRLGRPLKLVEGQHELGGAALLAENGAEGRPPVSGRHGCEKRLPQGPGGRLHEGANLELGGRLLAEEVESRLVADEMKDELALAHPAAPVDGDELGAPGPVGPLQHLQLRLAADEHAAKVWPPGILSSLNLTSRN